MRKNFIQPILLFFIIVVFAYPTLLHGKLPIPSDAIVALYHPYRDFYYSEFPQGYPFKNFLITDPLLQQYPWRESAINALAHFKLPLWNPYSATGEPLLANIQSATFYPLNLLFLIFPFRIGWSVLIYLQPLLASLFLYSYLRYMKLTKNASFLGSIVFAFCGFSTAWFEWNTLVQTALWLPLILLAIEHLLEKISYKWIIVLIFAQCAAFFAGHIQTFFYLLLVYDSYLLARIFQITREEHQKKYFWKKAWRRYYPFIIYGLVVVVITAIQWVPALQLINLSARSTDQLWRKDGWFIPWQHLIQFFAPDFFGNPTTQNYWGTWNYGEMVGYAGIGPLVLALYAMFFRSDRKTFFFGTVFFLSLLFSLETFLAELPFTLHIPFISTTQPTRLLFLTDFSLAVLSALGIDHYVRQQKKITILYPILFIGIVYGFLWFYLIKINRYLFQISPQQLSVAKHNLLIPTLLFFLSSLLLLSLIKSTKKQLIVTVFIIVTLIDLLRFSWKFNTFTDSSLLYPQTKTTEFLYNNSRNYPWRFLGIDYVQDQKRILPPNLSVHAQTYTLDTYNPLLIRRYQEFAAVLEWGFVNIPDFSFNRTIILNNYNSRLIDFLGVKYIVAINTTTAKKLKYLFNEGDTIVYENTQAFPRAFMIYNVLTMNDKKTIAKTMYDQKTNLRTTAIVEQPLPLPVRNREVSNNLVEIKNYTADEVVIEVSTTHEGLLVLTDTFYPTWHVTVDGKNKKIYRTDYDFRGVFIPKGSHHVIFTDRLL